MKILFYSVLCSYLLFAEAISYDELIKTCKSEQMKGINQINECFVFDKDTQFHPIEGGLTKAKLYWFEKGSKKYVLRFLSIGSHQSREMRHNEIRALQIAAELGIAPECLFVDEDATVMVMPFIEGRPFYKPNHTELMQLGIALAKLHKFSGEYPLRYTFQKRLERHYKKGIQSGVAYPTGFEEEINKLINELPLRAMAPSHGDLNPSNILVGDGEVFIIDWTAASLDDPFADISCISVLADLSLEEEKILLKSYFGREASSDEYRDLQKEKAKVYLLTAAIWFRFSETAEDQNGLIEERIRKLDSDLYDPSLKPAQEYLRERIVVNIRTAPQSEIRAFALSFYKAYLEAQRSYPEEG